MRVAALLTWAVTALAGAGLLAIWLIEYNVSGRGGAASRLPRTVIGCHAGIAVCGWLTWLAYLLTGWQVLAWIVLAGLAVVATLGSVMVGRQVQVRRALAVAAGDPSLPRPRIPMPTESHFPLPLVLGHGALAVTTVTLVALTVLR